MKKPKSKLEKAKEGFVEEWGETIQTANIYIVNADRVKRFRRQLNNLIRLAKQEALEGKPKKG